MLMDDWPETFACECGAGPLEWVPKALRYKCASCGQVLKRDSWNAAYAETDIDKSLRAYIRVSRAKAWEDTSPDTVSIGDARDLG